MRHAALLQAGAVAVATVAAAALAPLAYGAGPGAPPPSRDVAGLRAWALRSWPVGTPVADAARGLVARGYACDVLPRPIPDVTAEVASCRRPGEAVDVGLVARDATLADVTAGVVGAGRAGTASVADPRPAVDADGLPGAEADAADRAAAWAAAHAAVDGVTPRPAPPPSARASKVAPRRR